TGQARGPDRDQPEPVADSGRSHPRYPGPHDSGWGRDGFPGSILLSVRYPMFHRKLIVSSSCHRLLLTLISAMLVTACSQQRGTPDGGPPTEEKLLNLYIWSDY